MLDRQLETMEFIQKSLGLNLFFLRIMKEHSLILEAGIAPGNTELVEAAGGFRRGFNNLLNEAVRMADGNVSRTVLESQEIVTDRTLEAEEKTEELSGIDIDTALTKMEMMLRPGREDPGLEDAVRRLNSQAINLTRSLADFKTTVLNEVLDCNLFTFVLPSMIEHLREEADTYIEYLEKLQQGSDPYREMQIMETKAFWDHIMAEHAQFVAHLLDPSEAKLIRQANRFAERFFGLAREAEWANSRGRFDRYLRALIQEEIRTVRDIRDFKRTGEDMILGCQVRSVIIPLLADHILREANHFLAVLVNR
ncbi:MAG: DUF2935 domain-containing protein [Syntrophomonadaceae bacterium]|nr:DUF2935 domain-containing protein [Syntrophomonadaceae bacterium]